MKYRMSFILLVLVSLLAGCEQVQTGNIGIKRALGQVDMTELPPGGYEVIGKDVIEVSGKEQVISMQDLKPKAKENLTMQDFDFDVYYKINPTYAADIYVKYSGDMVEIKDTDTVSIGGGLVSRHAREAAYNSASKYEFATMQNNRAEIAADIEKNLQMELDNKSIKGAFTIVNVVIRNITTDKALEDSIREAAQVEFETRKKVQQLLLAQAEADRMKVEAMGIAAANEIVSASLTPQLLDLRKTEIMSQTIKDASGKGHTLMIGVTAQPLVSSK